VTVLEGLAVTALPGGVPAPPGASLLFNIGIARIPAGRAALVFNLVPVFGTVAAVIGLGERLRTVEVMGGGLIVLSLFALTFAGEAEDQDPPVLVRWIARVRGRG